MQQWLETLRDALDLVEYGVVLLDENLDARFINRAFCDMWRYPPMADGDRRSFESLMEHGYALRNYAVPNDDLPAYVAERIARVRNGHDGPRMLRLFDGRIIKFECIPLPQGGRMLTYADQTELTHSVERLEAVVNVDELTQLYNRRYLYSRGEQEIALAKRHAQPLSVIMLDIDHFKEVNDNHGHAAGDAVLRSIAACCRATSRSTDLVGRLGGEEFAIILPHTDLQSTLYVAERLRIAIAAGAVSADLPSLRVTASFGVAAFADADDRFEQLLQRADGALYEAKHGGRNRVVAAR